MHVYVVAESDSTARVALRTLVLHQVLKEGPIQKPAKGANLVQVDCVLGETCDQRCVCLPFPLAPAYTRAATSGGGAAHEGRAGTSKLPLRPE
jgi:hypothetical protein